MNKTEKDLNEIVEIYEENKNKKIKMTIPELTIRIKDHNDNNVKNIAKSISDQVLYKSSFEDVSAMFGVTVNETKLLYNAYELMNLLDNDNDSVNTLLQSGYTIDIINNIYKVDKELFVLEDEHIISCKYLNLIKEKLGYNGLPEVIKYIRKIHDSKLLDSLLSLYPDFPYSCYDITKIIYTIIDQNVKRHNCKRVIGHFNVDGYWIPHSWIKCGKFIIDPTLIQFVSINESGCNNFRDYFNKKGGVTKAIQEELGGMIVYQDNNFYNRYYAESK